MEEEGNTHIFHYNLQGQLIQQSNYKSDGRLKREKHYIWLDDMPLVFLETVYKKNGSIKREELAYITADHLNTPRFATNQNQEIVWTWRSDAFGIGKIEKDSDGNGTKTNIKLRFPGQYEDGESGLHYNYFPDYHPVWGRYAQSDPIGLDGGLNSYGYVLQNPLINFDLFGLVEDSITASLKAAIARGDVRKLKTLKEVISPSQRKLELMVTENGW